MSEPAKKATSRIRNWAEYNSAPTRRGSLTVGADERALRDRSHRGPAHWGGPYGYSDVAIRCPLTLRAASHLPPRATRGMAASLLGWMGPDLAVPHYSTLPRRAAAPEVDLARESKGPPHLVRGSTGLEVYGAGGWEVRKHGSPERRARRELHPATGAESHGIQAAAVTGAGVDGAEEVGHLPTPLDREVASAAADGAYDQREVDRVPGPRAGRILIPPRKGARIGERGNSAGPPWPVVRTCGTSGGSAAGRGSGRVAPTPGRWRRRGSSA